MARRLCDLVSEASRPHVPFAENRGLYGVLADEHFLFHLVEARAYVLLDLKREYLETWTRHDYVLNSKPCA